MTHALWYREISRIWGVRVVPKTHFRLLQGGERRFKKHRPFSVVVLIGSMSNHMVLEPYDKLIWFQQEISQTPEPCEI